MPGRERKAQDWQRVSVSVEITQFEQKVREQIPQIELLARVRWRSPNETPQRGQEDAGSLVRRCQ
jgi:hypothetical protein